MQRLIRVSIACLLLSVGGWLPLGATAGETIRDAFDAGDLSTRPGWHIEAGQPGIASGELTFPGKGKSAVRLDLGAIAWKQVVSVRFRLRKTTASGNVLFRVTLGESEWEREREYSIACSPNPGYFATSGFYDGKRVGTAGASLRKDDAWQELVLRFDPQADLVCLSLDGKTVWETTNHHRLPRVDRLRLSAEGGVGWRVDDVRVDLVRPATAASDPGIAAVQTVYRGGVPHTDKNGRLLQRFDANRSFFQIGMWGVPLGEVQGTRYDPSVLADAGFNTIWPWGRRWFEQAADPRSPVPFQVVHMGPMVLDALRKYKDSPRLLGIVWRDEPTGSLWGKNMAEKFEEFKAYRNQVHQIAPHLPVFINDVPWIQAPATDWWIRWNTAGDVACHDNYPIKHSGCVASVAEMGAPVSLAVRVNGEKKPIWLIVGAFEQPGRSAFPFRFPTPAQLRACVYAGLIHGATGVVYFTWDTYVCRDGNVIGMSADPKVAYVPNPRKPGYTHPTPATPLQLVQSKAAWLAAVEINRELRELWPMLLAPTVAENTLSYSVTTELSHSEHPIRCLLKPHPRGGFVLLSCNVDASVVQGRFRFSRGLKSAERMFENQPAWGIEKGSTAVTLDYEPFETHVLRLQME